MKICVIHVRFILLFSFIVFFCINIRISLAGEQRVYSDSDKQAWCDYGKKVDNIIYEARERLRKCEESAKDLRSAVFWKKATDEEVKKKEADCAEIKEDLEKAEKVKNDFEFDAYQKGIQPGWLRCQF